MNLDEQLTQGARIVASGGVIAHPTEGVFGLACDPASSIALERIVRIKDRDRGKGVILMAHGIDALLPYCGALTPDMIETITAPKAHPTTYIVPAAAAAPGLLTGGRHTLAVRVTEHPLSRTLCETLGHPIISTSANRSGESPARDASTVRRTLGEQLDMIIDAPLGGATGPSAIVNIATGQIIRAAPTQDADP